MGDNRDNLKKMIRIYQPNGVDWMNFALTRRNPYTFHHIIPRSDGGNDSIENGAILTRRAHDLLHLLENSCPDAYNDLQEIFMKINESNEPLSDDVIREIDDILYNIFTETDYSFLTDIDLSPYINLYYHQVKKKTKIFKK